MLEKREQELIANNLNEISFYFFFIIGLIHIISGLLLANDYFPATNWILNRLLDIPFLIVTLIYIYSSIKIHLLKNNTYSHSYDLLIVTLLGVIGLSTFFADLIFTNQLPL